MVVWDFGILHPPIEEDFMECHKGFEPLLNSFCIQFITKTGMFTLDVFLGDFSVISFTYVRQHYPM